MLQWILGQAKTNEVDDMTYPLANIAINPATNDAFANQVKHYLPGYDRHLKHSLQALPNFHPI